MVLVIVASIVGIITAVIAVSKLVPPSLELYWRKRYNKNICSVIIKLRDKFIKDKYNVDPVDFTKPFLIEKGKETNPTYRTREDFVVFLLPSSSYKSVKNLDLDTLTLLLEWGVKKPIKDVLTYKGLDEEDANEIAIEEVKEFTETNLPETLVKKLRDVEYIKKKIIENQSTSLKGTLIRKNINKIKNVVRSNFKGNLKKKYDEYWKNQPAYNKLVENDVNEILKMVQKVKVIKDDYEVEDKEFKFGRSSKEKLIELKTAFLNSRKKFIQKVNQIDNRSEQILALILEYPGKYEMEMNKSFGIPQPTISIYSEVMVKNGLVIKDNFSTKGNYVFLYPRFSKVEIQKNLDRLKNYEVLFIDKLIVKKGEIFFECLKEVKVTFNLGRMNIKNYAGTKVITKARVEEDKSLSITWIGIYKPRTQQESLHRYI